MSEPDPTIQAYAQALTVLADTLRQVEYYSDHRNNACPWCHGLDPAVAAKTWGGQVSGSGHYPNCPREAALALFDIVSHPDEPST